MTIRHPLAAASILYVILTGCVSAPSCPSGMVWDADEARCRGTLSDGGTDAPRDVPCGGCSAPMLCDAATGRCVECLGADASTCPDGFAVCVENECAACSTNVDCTDPAMAVCNSANECTPCAYDEDCADRADTPVCDEYNAICVACTVDSEAETCGANSCDPATFTCTSTARMSRHRCESCSADSECRDADDRCVPMEFMGTPLSGGYCLKRGATGCLRPYGWPTPPRASLSGAEPEVYCAIFEDLTTCEALRDVIDAVACASDEDCGVPGLADGRCETANGIRDICTYACSAASQCVTGHACPFVSNSYCGAP